MDLDQFIKKEVGIRAEFLSDFVYLFGYKNKFIFLFRQCEVQRLKSIFKGRKV